MVIEAFGGTGGARDYEYETGGHSRPGRTP